MGSIIVSTFIAIFVRQNINLGRVRTHDPGQQIIQKWPFSLLSKGSGNEAASEKGHSGPKISHMRCQKLKLNFFPAAAKRTFLCVYGVHTKLYQFVIFRFCRWEMIVMHDKQQQQQLSARLLSGLMLPRTFSMTPFSLWSWIEPNYFELYPSLKLFIEPGSSSSLWA